MADAAPRVPVDEAAGHEDQGEAGDDRGPRPRHALRQERAVAVAGERLEEAHLLVEVVPDDVPIPALARRLEEIAQVGPGAGELALRGGVAGRRRVEGEPALVLDEDLDPRVRVALAHGVEVAEAVPRAADEAGDVARGDAEGAEHDRHRGGVVLAVPALRVEEEVVEGCLLLPEGELRS